MPQSIFVTSSKKVWWSLRGRFPHHLILADVRGLRKAEREWGEGHSKAGGVDGPGEGKKV